MGHTESSANGHFPVFNRFMDTTDDSHVYRLELHRATETYEFYIDGNLVRTSIGVMNQVLDRFDPDWALGPRLCG